MLRRQRGPRLFQYAFDVEKKRGWGTLSGTLDPFSFAKQRDIYACTIVCAKR